MKTLALFFLALVSTASFAETSIPGNNHAPADRVLNDVILKSVIQGVEAKYKMRCRSNQDLIRWRCLNGPTCGFIIDIPCTSRMDRPSTGLTVAIEVSGMTTLNKTDIDTIEIKRAE